MKITNISYNDLFKACQFYAQREERDYIYPAAITKLQNNFGNAKIMADAVSDLLKVWHFNFYRFGKFDPMAIEQCIKTKSDLIKKYALLNIRQLTFSDSEIAEIEKLFSSFLDATAGTNAKFTRKSPTAVSKTLNLLAPKCFPLWDEAISQAYDCWWVYSDFGFNEYIKFIETSKTQCIDIVTKFAKTNSVSDIDVAEKKLIVECISLSGTIYDRSLLKIIDEYNYAKYTKHWL